MTKFFFPADRKLALGSQLLQRFIVPKIYSNGKPCRNIPTLASIPIVRDPQSGRPSYVPSSHEVEEGQKWVLRDYNVSHHNSRSTLRSDPCLVVLIARITAATPTSTSLRIGVDLVPTVHNRGPAAAFLETFRDSDVFTANEIKNIYAPSDEEDRVKMLYLHWALKEAYCKAVGTGLVTDLLAIDFRNVGLDIVETGKRDTRVKVFVDGVERKEWMLEIGQLLEGHYVAVAADSWSSEEGKEETGKWHLVDFEEDILKHWSGGAVFN